MSTGRPAALSLLSAGGTSAKAADKLWWKTPWKRFSLETTTAMVSISGGNIDGGFGKRTRRTVQGSTGSRIKIQAQCATTNGPITVSLTGTRPCWTRTKSRVTRIGAGGLPPWILTID